MVFNRNLYLLFFVMAGFGAHAQSAAIVKYDPLFWQNDLNLKAEQRNRINEINLEFYQNIQREFQVTQNDQSALKIKIDKNLQARSEEIWSTLYPRQRKKWERLMRRNYGDNQI